MTTSKTIQISDDNITFYTLPASSADLVTEAAAVTDSVLGQTFVSNFSGLGSWSLSSDAIRKGIAGYEVAILETGTPTATTGESMTLVSGQVYKATTEARNLWDYNSTVTIYDNAVDVTANVVEFNYLLGQITFDSGYSVTGPVTADFSYMAVSEYGCFNTMTLTQTQNVNDDTCFSDARGNGGLMTNNAGLRDISLSCQGFRRAGFDSITDLLARDIFLLEIRSDAGGYSKARGYFQMSSTNPFGGSVGDNPTVSVDFRLYVPSSDFKPFVWDHDLVNTTLSQAVLLLLTGFADQTNVYVRLLPNGTADLTDGWVGSAIISDLSLTSEAAGVPKFTVNVTGDGALTSTTP